MTFVMTNQTARQRILAFLRSHHGASAAEISRSLRVTTANIRRHLSILVSDGRVQVLGLRPVDGPGRPIQIYGVANESDDESMTRLADALLAQAVETGSGAYLQNLAKRLMIQQPGKSAAGNVSITHRLATTIECLNSQGYGARWEAHAAAPRIIFENCPFRALVDDHPELCSMDRFLLAGYVGREVEQIMKLEKNVKGVFVCQFVVGAMAVK